MINNRITGFSLAEIMLALMLGILAVTAMMRLYSEVIRARNGSESFVNLEERTAFALAELERDILLAGFWGMHTVGSRINTAGISGIHCNGNDLSNWALNLQIPIETNQALPCSTSGPAMPDSDILIIRRASAAPVQPRAGTVQLETSPVQGRLFDDGTVLQSASRVHDLKVHAWFIENRSSEPGLPSLRRMTLTHGGAIQNQEIMPGVEKIRILLGIDQDGDLIADQLIAAGESATTPGSQIVMAQIELTVRSNRYAASVAEPDGYRRTRIKRRIKIRNAPLS